MYSLFKFHKKTHIKWDISNKIGYIANYNQINNNFSFSNFNLDRLKNNNNHNKYNHYNRNK